MPDQKLILVNLLIKIGVAAAVSSTLVRSLEFKKLLFREERSTRQKIYLTIWFATPIALAVWIRFIQKSFLAGDLSFDTTLLLGMLAGRLTAALGGAWMAFPAFWRGEWIPLPFNVLCGLAAGQLRSLAQDKEDVWSFSPFSDLSIYRWIRRNLPKPRFDWQIMFFATIVGLRFRTANSLAYFRNRLSVSRAPISGSKSRSTRLR